MGPSYIIISLVEGGIHGRMEGGCRMCKLPGRGNNRWMDVGNVQVRCQDRDNPSDLCHCEAGNPPNLTVDKNGRDKGPKCKDLTSGKLTENRHGEVWDCFSKKYE